MPVRENEKRVNSGLLEAEIRHFDLLQHHAECVGTAGDQMQCDFSLVVSFHATG